MNLNSTTNEDRHDRAITAAHVQLSASCFCRRGRVGLNRMSDSLGASREDTLGGGTSVHSLFSMAQTPKRETH